MATVAELTDIVEGLQAEIADLKLRISALEDMPTSGKSYSPDEFDVRLQHIANKIGVDLSQIAPPVVETEESVS